MIVRCINGDWSHCKSQFVKRILTVGDDHLLPNKGQLYEVIGNWKADDKRGYKLKELDHSNYGCILYFNVNHFEIHDDTFVPNCVDDVLGLCREESLVVKVWTNKN